MTKQIYILLIALLGFFLTPTLTYAYSKSHTQTEKSCCDKKTSQTDKNDCCKNKSSHNQKDNDDCGGKCGHSSCHCPTVSFSFIPSTSELKYHVVSASQQPYSLYSVPHISRGSHCNLPPPKIT